MGRPLPGVRAWIEDGELVVDPATLPTFFLGYAGRRHPACAVAHRRSGPAGRRRLPRSSRAATDDVIISSGYRIGPFEIESVLGRAPRRGRGRGGGGTRMRSAGEVVRAFVVLRDGHRAVAPRTGPRAAGARQGADGALQVPAAHRLRGRPAAHSERQGAPLGAARAKVIKLDGHPRGLAERLAHRAHGYRVDSFAPAGRCSSRGSRCRGGRCSRWRSRVVCVWSNFSLIVKSVLPFSQTR